MKIIINLFVIIVLSCTNVCGENSIFLEAYQQDSNHNVVSETELLGTMPNSVDKPDEILKGYYDSGEVMSVTPMKNGKKMAFTMSIVI